ncbi:MAG: ABC transporter permease [Thermoleophilia bacterium]
MSNAVLVIAGQELRAARTNHLAMMLIGIFTGMVFVSGFIGWEAHHTVTSVYQETLREGATSAPDPFAAQQPLGLIKNTVIYVILIGGLAAILLGVQAAAGDRKAGVLDLLYTRPVSIGQYTAGKLLGIQCLTGLVLAAAAAMSWIVIWLIQGRALSFPDTGSLAAFFALAWLFLLPFAALGFILGAMSRRETSALLVPILVWVLAAFVVPQLGTADHPVSLLNPVPAQPASQGPFFSFNRRVLQPLSITDRFKNASAGLLHLDEQAGQSRTGDWLSLAGIAAASCFAARLAARREIMRKPFYE